MDITALELILSLLCFFLLIASLVLYKSNIFLKQKADAIKRQAESQLDFENRFKHISNEALIQNHKTFLNIATETFSKVLNTEKIEFENKKHHLENLLFPIHKSLELFNSKISEMEKERIDSYSDLRRHINDMMQFQQEIQKETSALNKALSSPIMTGQWGEMQLRRVVELSGMLSHCDFVEQTQSDSSRMRPDMIIKLPGNRNIIVDSKAPIDAYMQAINTDNESLLEHHAKRIRSHIKTLGQKSYWSQFSPTPEFVLLFLPGEAFFSAAVKKDPSLIEYGVQEKVIITTPITLIALLKSISFAWQQAAITENAKKIGEVGRSLFYNLEKLFECTRGFEKKLRRNIEDYEKINSIIEKKIVPDALKLHSLGLEADDKKDSKFIDNETTSF